MNMNILGPIFALCTAFAIEVAGCKGNAPTPPAPSEAPVQSTGKVSVIVGDNGFVPSAINATKGQPLTLEFKRVSDKTCATQVVFPELNITKDLPLNSAVSISIPTDQARKLAFQCGMGMFKSSVVIQ
jgi:plastocyanin domain-containing protein